MPPVGSAASPKAPQLRGAEVERLLEVARTHERAAGEAIARIELHATTDGRWFHHGIVVSASGKEIVRVGSEDDPGYPDARAAWDALKPGPGVGVAVRSLSISMDGRIRFD